MLTNPIFDCIKEFDSPKKATNLSIGVKTFIMFCIMVASCILSWYISITLLLSIVFVGVVFLFMSVFLAVSNPKFASVFTVLFSFSIGFAIGSATRYIDESFENVATTIAFSIGTAFFVPLLWFTFTGLKNLRQFKVASFSIVMSVCLVEAFIFLYSWLYTKNLDYVYGRGFWVLLVAFFITVIELIFFIINFTEADRFVDNNTPKKNEWLIVLGLVFSTIAIYYQLLQFLKKMMSYIFDKKIDS